MYTEPAIPELRLSDSSRVRFFRHASTGELIVQLWRPMLDRNDYGLMYSAQVVLSGNDAQAFIAALTEPREPELLPAA